MQIYTQNGNSGVAHLPNVINYLINKTSLKVIKPIFSPETVTMGLPLRITFDDKDYVYQIVNSKLVGPNTTELELLLNGEKVELIKDAKMVWTLKEGNTTLDPNLVQALGRSVSLRLRM